MTAKTAKLDKNSRKVVESLMEKGKERGHLTLDELNEALPDNLVMPDQIDNILMMFDEMDIEIVDGAKVTVAEKPPPEKAISNTVNAGIYMLDPQVFKHIAPGENVDFGSSS